MALDVFEERKWKKGISYVYASQISSKVKKQKSKKKLDELYKRCMCLYLSMTVNNNFSDISQGKINKNMSDKLNIYIKNVSNIDYFNRQFTHWKEYLKEIKSKLEKKFGENNIKNAKNFFKVLDLMENMINIQEEAMKKIQSYNNALLIRDNLEDLEMRPCDLDIHLPTLEVHLDWNILDKELNELMEEITNELNNNDEIMFTNEMKTIHSPQSKNTNEDELIMNINPKQLFFNNKDMPNNVYDLQSHVSKIMNTDKVITIPCYNYSKMILSEYDEMKGVEEFEKVYYRVFPSIFFTDKTQQDKALLESEIDVYRTKHDKVIKEQDPLRLYNHKFQNTTILQRLTFLWAISNYGLNMNIVSEIPNIYGYSKSLSYDNEEVFVYLDRVLEKFNVDLLVSNFENVVKNRSSSHYIYYLDPPMLNSTHCNFNYNKKMLNYINYKVDSMEYKDNFHHFPIIPSMVNNRLLNIQRGINLIKDCPVFKRLETKRSHFNNLRDNLKKIAEKVENMSMNQPSYNYFTMIKSNTSLKGNVLKVYIINYLEN